MTEYLRAQYKGESIKHLQTGSQHMVRLRRRPFKGYEIIITHGYWRKPGTYRFSYDSLFSLTRNWDFLDIAK